MSAPAKKKTMMSKLKRIAKKSKGVLIDQRGKAVSQARLEWVPVVIVRKTKSGQTREKKTAFKVGSNCGVLRKSKKGKSYNTSYKKVPTSIRGRISSDRKTCRARKLHAIKQLEIWGKAWNPMKRK